MPEPTKAQGEALRWLSEKFGDGRFASSALMTVYEERERAKPETQRFGYHHSTDRAHGWRRTSGAVMARMRRAGWLAYGVGDQWTTYYVLTQQARDWLNG